MDPSSSLIHFWQQLQRITLLHPFFLVSLFLLSLFFLFICTRSSGNLKLPPSPPSLPIIGNLHQLGTQPHRSLKVLSEKYGPLMLLHFGHVPTLVVSSSEVVAEIIKNHDVIFSGRPKTTASDILFYGGKDVGFAPYGEYWRQVRKICVVELLSLRRVQEFHYVREEEVAILVDKLSKASLDESCVNLSEMLIATSNNIICRCVLGQSYSEEKDGGSKYGELSRRMMSHMVAFSFGDFFPYLKWIDVLRGFTARVKSTAKELDAFSNQVIKEYKAKKSYGGSTNVKNFVDILLQVQKDGRHDFELTREDMKAILQDMLVAGTDTTSTTIEWLMAELIRNPRVMKKTQEEVRRVVGKKPEIDINDVNQMAYLKCVIKESMRLHPTAPFLVPRETTSSTEMREYHIPAKTRVLINAFAINRDSNSWERPEEFFPERFENNPIDFKGQDSQLIPFGFGRRGCPGLMFGIVNVEYIIANLLYWFDWKLSDNRASNEDLDMSEICEIVLHKNVPLHLVPVSYSF